jgi:hypothetical protein
MAWSVHRCLSFVGCSCNSNFSLLNFMLLFASSVINFFMSHVVALWCSIFSYRIDCNSVSCICFLSRTLRRQALVCCHCLVCMYLFVVFSSCYIYIGIVLGEAMWDVLYLLVHLCSFFFICVCVVIAISRCAWSMCMFNFSCINSVMCCLCWPLCNWILCWPTHNPVFPRWTFATICTLHSNSGWPLNLSCAKCCEAKQIFSCGHSFCLCYEQFFLLLLTSVNGVSALCSLCLLVQAHMHYISCQYASFFMALFFYFGFVCENI